MSLRIPQKHSAPSWEDQRGHSNRKLRFQGFCRSIRLIERVFWSFYSTVRSDMQYWLAFSWPYNLLSDKVLRITVYSCANAPAGPSWLTTAATLPPHDLLPGGTYLSVTRAGRDGVAGAACADQRGQGEGEAIGDGQDVGCPTPCRAGAWVSANKGPAAQSAVPGAVRLRRPAVTGPRPQGPCRGDRHPPHHAGGRPCLGTQSPRCHSDSPLPLGYSPGAAPVDPLRGQTASLPASIA